MGFYDNGLQSNHYKAAVAYNLIANGFKFNGPSGMAGRVLDCFIETTTAITTNDLVLKMGKVGGTTVEQFATWTLPFTGSAIGDYSRAPAATLSAAEDIAADAVTGLLSTNGASGAAAGDTRVIVNWW